MIYVFYIALFFLGIRFSVALANLFARPYLQSATLTDFPKVSILIPARNEAENIEATLQSISTLSYPHLEVYVLDDGSEDETYSIVERFSEKDDRFQIQKGRPLPDGWLGKNWACHQLSQFADGEHLLFVDADVTLQNGAIEGGLVEMQERKLALLSVFPDQIMHSMGELLVVPLMHHLLLSLLPLPLVTASKNPAFAAANGQFMLFEAASYRAQKWHERVKSAIVEDIEIMKMVKSTGLKGRVLLGNGLVYCRMYHNFNQGWKGFSKNLLAGFNHSIIGLFLYLFLLVFAWGALGFVEPVFTGIFLILALGIRVIVSLLGKQSILKNLLFHPLQIAIWTGIGFRSAWVRLRGTNEWKGRNINLKKNKKSATQISSQQT